jgi:hypothetical protein
VHTLSHRHSVMHLLPPLPRGVLRQANTLLAHSHAINVDTHAHVGELHLDNTISVIWYRSRTRGNKYMFCQEMYLPIKRHELYGTYSDPVELEVVSGSGGGDAVLLCRTNCSL